MRDAQVNFVNAIRGAAVARILGVGLLAAPPADARPPHHAGLCLFGHVNRNSRSACRLGYQVPPLVDSDPLGTPYKRCGPRNDGERVLTVDAHGKKHIKICGNRTHSDGYVYWEWIEMYWA